MISSTLAPVYLGVVPSYEHNSEADVATNFLAIVSSCFSLNAPRRQPVSGETLFVYKDVCVCFIYVYIYINKYIYYMHFIYFSPHQPEKERCQTVKQ